MKFSLRMWAAFLLALVIFSSCQKDERLPNIVLIMADDMGYECLGCNGSTEYKTPNMDRLATEGIRFENCYSQPLCTPSRVKIMTGQYNFRNYEDFGYLNPNQKTFANYLKEAGYTTCIAGKWQLNGLNRNNPDNQDVNRPHHFGFDEYCLWQLNRQRSEGERYADPLITQNGKDLQRDAEGYGPQIFSDYIVDFIRRKSGEPFFVYYPMALVHDPFVPTSESPEWQDPTRRYEQDTAYFADMMAFTDKIVGKIEKELKDNGLWENTLFIFTADNGTNVKVMSKTTYGKVKGGKGLSLNTGNHVPMIVSWPEKMIACCSENALVSFADFLPTFCEVAGISLENVKTDGKSLVPIITGEKSVQDEIFIHYSPRWGNRVHDRWVMDGKYKLYQDGRFYDTSKDTLEKHVVESPTMEEQEIKTKFQNILDEKEQEFSFHLNDSIFKLKN